ncbi:oligosaccharide flippase family protein [Cellulomonas dongxiuzhuiae]|uniref:oligosaccharide flippase family protein n=1 Tax=Cellulomonas dongxiuzhuiae TaxID=2819979 RepID=UPI001AAF58EF|nr:oligosaccharide flippase family protein [Cellulomonas dongxiuzhuiae]MBO3086692.1 oligosaccharide flippase family protein [Cellulomonas dongxiuzhuiae]
MSEVAQSAALRRMSLLSLVGGAASGVGMFALSAVVARSASTSDFADFGFVLALSQVWFILTVAGLELAAPRLLAGRSPEDRGVIVGSVLAVTAALAVGAGVVALLVADPLAGATRSTRVLVLMAAAFGVATGWRAIVERLSAAHGRIGAVAAVKFAEAAVIVGGAAVAVLVLGQPTWNVFAGTAVLAALVAVGAYLAVLHRGTAPWRVSAGTGRQLLAFARYSAPTTVFAVAMMYIDKFALRIGGDDAQYAQYTAYFSGSLLLAVQAVFVLQSIVLPATVRAASGVDVRRHLRRAVPVLLLALPLSFVCSGWLVVQVLGPKYHYVLGEGAVFAVWATLYTINILGMTACVARSSRAMRQESIVLVARTTVAVLALGALVVTGRIDIPTVALVMVALELCESVNVIAMARRHLV